jgi:hypothetical protein
MESRHVRLPLMDLDLAINNQQSTVNDQADVQVCNALEQ